jgi:hypothetical protein
MMERGKFCPYAENDHATLQTTMNSVLFSDSPARGNLHLLPKQTAAISYTFTPDRLFLAAHMEDNFAKVNQADPRSQGIYDDFYRANCINCTHEGGRRCESVRDYGVNSATVCPKGLTIVEEKWVSFDVAPAVFQMDLIIDSRENRFRVTNEYQKAFLQATQVVNNRIKFTRHRKNLANTRSSHIICWGRNCYPKSLKSMVKLFFDTPFNNDLTEIREFVQNNKIVKNDIAEGNFFRTYAQNYKFIAEKADALFMLHAEDNISAFFWMISAGFKPLKEANYIMLLPLRETVIEHEGINYPGYLTMGDSCEKEWFVTKTGELIGQL